MNKQNNISRRDFLKAMGMAGATAGLAACGNSTSPSANSDSLKGEMTYRTNPSTGDKVSLLGFGMMRLPSVGGRSAREGNEEIDQEMVNRMVDYAIEHGVNYFDTSPAYCRGKSEHATGVALSRHPRNSYFIATKLSNFAPDTWKRENAIAMYHNSLKELRTDYIDYLLLHGIGMGNGMEEYEARYVNNGMLDFLLAEREAGRIRNLGFSYHGDVKVFDRLLAEHDKYQWNFVQIQLNYLDWKYAKQINPRNTDAEYLYNELAKRNIPESSQDADYRRARRAYLIDYDRSVPKLRQASHCIGCNQCSPHCPQRIDIPTELHRIDHFVEQLKQETL